MQQGKDRRCLKKARIAGSRDSREQEAADGLGPEQRRNPE